VIAVMRARHTVPKLKRSCVACELPRQAALTRVSYIVPTGAHCV
jgi:hypothetical protein